MSITASAVEGIHRAESRLEYIASKLAVQTEVTGRISDQVSLSEVATAILESRTAVAANVKAFQAGDEMEKRILDLAG